MSHLSIAQLSAQLDQGHTTAERVAQEALEGVMQRDTHHAFLTPADADSLLASAVASDRRRAQGLAPRLLEAIPIAIKDNICQRDMRTTAGSAILDTFISPYDATVIERLRDAGALLIGKTNLDAFGMGSSGEHSAFAVTTNPHDATRTPGGSSSGSAAAVAAHLCCAALGSDTGGSIRQPAAYCGVVGLKPTYGRVSRFGLVAYASSLDQIGPLARSVEDAARLLDVIAGHDPRDATSSAHLMPSLLPHLDQPIQGLRVGVARQHFEVDGLDPRVRAAVEEALDALIDQGATRVELDLPHAHHAVATYYLIATAEASANLARYDGVRYGHRASDMERLEDLYEQSRAQGFGEEVKRRILLGTFVLSSGFYDAYYDKALRARTLICQDFERAFAQCDVLLSPATSTPAFRLGESRPPLSMYLEDIYTIACNLAGLPAISLPVGRAEGLPIGAQLLARHFDEVTLLRAASALERALSHSSEARP